MENQIQTNQAMVAGLSHAQGATGHLSHASSIKPHTLAPSKEYAPGKHLFLQGSSAKEVFFVERGLVKLIRLGEDGQGIIVGLRSAGSFIGAAAVIVQEPHPVSAITITSCNLSYIPVEAFLRLAKTDPHFCWYLHQVHSREVHQQASQLANLRNLSARQRFENLLFQFVSSVGYHEREVSRKIHLPLKNWEIAQLIGITPEHLSRVLRQIQEEGILRKENGCMVVDDVRRLYQPSEQ
jgi:CRP-like cAMP-binding protein